MEECTVYRQVMESAASPDFNDTGGVALILFVIQIDGYELHHDIDHVQCKPREGNGMKKKRGRDYEIPSFNHNL